MNSYYTEATVSKQSILNHPSTEIFSTKAIACSPCRACVFWVSER